MRRPLAPLALALLILLPIAGCVTPDPAPEAAPAPATGPVRYESAAFTVVADLRAGALVNLTVTTTDGSPLTLAWDAPAFLLKDGRFSAVEGLEMNSGETARILLPPTLTDLPLEVETGATKERFNFTLPANSTVAAFVSGEGVLNLTTFAGQTYPYRAAGTQPYSDFLLWAAGYFEGLGMRAVVDPYGIRDAPRVPNLPPWSTQVSSAANVCGFLDGAEAPNEWIVFGGHFDIVEGIPEGAYDDTTGTMIVFELARAFAGMKPARTLVFCGWGGEEDGLVGSQVFAKAIPPTVRVLQYHNFDMAGMNWPMVPDPAAPIPLTIAGQETYGEAMVAYAESVLRGILDYPPEGVPTGTYRTGASDHLSFYSQGIPAYSYSAMGGGAYPHYHEVEDTVANMTAVAIGKSTTADFEPGDAERGYAALARGIDTVLWSALYLALGAELGQFEVTPVP